MLLVLFCCSCSILVYVCGSSMRWFLSRNSDIILAPSSICIPDFNLNLFNLCPCSENLVHIKEFCSYKIRTHIYLLPPSPLHHLWVELYGKKALASISLPVILCSEVADCCNNGSSGFTSLCP